MRNEDRITGKKFQEYKNKMFFVWVFKPNGEYDFGWDNVNVIKAAEIQMEAHLNGKHCIIWTMNMWHRVPACPSECRLNTNTYAFKMAIMPILIREPYNPHMTWAEVEAFVRSQGYNQERNRPYDAIEVKGEVVE